MFNIAHHNRFYLNEDIFKIIIRSQVDTMRSDKYYKSQESVQYSNLQYFTHTALQIFIG